MSLPASTLTMLFNRPAEEAVAYLQGKGLKLTERWQDLRDEAHARAFTVAKVASLDVLQDLRDGLVTGLQTGLTRRQYIQQLTPILQDKGWWGKQVRVDSDGNAQVVQLGSPRRLRTIYETNMQSAYMAGRHVAMMAATATHPLWRYVAVMDNKTRPTHAALHNTTYRYDDPAWAYIFAPNGYNCRCRIVAMTEEAARRYGYHVQSSLNKLGLRSVEIGVDPRTGEVETAEVASLRGVSADGKPFTFSPDPSFNTAPTVAYQPRLDGYDTDLVARYVQATVTGPAFERFVQRQQAQVAQEGYRPSVRTLSASAKAKHLAAQGGPAERFPVGVLPEALQARVGGTAKAIWLDASSLRAMVGQPLAPTMDDFRAVTEVVHSAPLVVRTGTGRLVIVAPDGGAYRRAVLRLSPNRGWELENIDRIRVADVERLQRARQVLVNRLETSHV